MMTERTNGIRKAVLKVADYMQVHGIEMPGDLAAHLEDIKTVDFFRRALRRAVLDFYRGDIDAFEFIDEMIRLIEGQFQRAWNEGARSCNVQPDDMLPEWEAVLRERINQEMNHVLGFASDVERAGQENTPIEPLYSRVDIWVNRYNEIVNLAKVTVCGDKKLEWKLGATERHCGTCAALDGVVAYASEWQASGYRPQNAPNPLLECGGWRCDCRLSETSKRRTRGGIPLV